MSAGTRRPLDGGVTGGVSYAGATSGRAGWLPRNAFTAPGFHNVDFRLARQFPISERLKLSLMGEAFNLFNHTNVSSVNTTAFNYTAARFGRLRRPYQRLLRSERGVPGSHGHQQPAVGTAAVASVGEADLLIGAATGELTRSRSSTAIDYGAGLPGRPALLISGSIHPNVYRRICR